MSFETSAHMRRSHARPTHAPHHLPHSIVPQIDEVQHSGNPYIGSAGTRFSARVARRIRSRAHNSQLRIPSCTNTLVILSKLSPLQAES